MQSEPDEEPYVRSPKLRSLPFLLLTAMLVSFSWSAPATAQTYDLVFNPTGPIVATEGDIVNVDVSVSGGCTPFNIDWDVSIQAVTADGSDVGTLMPDPVGLSDVGPTVGIQVPIVDDALIEDTESFFLVLTPISPLMTCSTPATEPAQSEYAVEIQVLDNEPTTGPRLRISGSTTVESAGSTAFEVKVVDPNPGDNYSVVFSTADGSAVAVEDYQGINGILVNLSSGAPQQFVNVNLVDDSISESTESFFGKLNTPVNAVIEVQAAEAVITDDDAVGEISIADQSVPEGDSGTSLVRVAVDLEFPAGATAQPVSVEYGTADRSAVAGEDYVATGGLLEFPPGTGRQFVEVEILGDPDVEMDELFAIELSNPVNATLLRRAGEVVIENDDVEGELPRLGVEDVAVDEGDSGSTQVGLRVALDQAAPAPVRVEWRTEDRTATAGEDYAAAEGVAEIPAGERTTRIPLRIRGDEIEEADETFVVLLANPENAELADPEATVTIRDDDEAGGGGDGGGGEDGGDDGEDDDGGGDERSVVRLRPSPGPVGEGAGSVILAAERVGSARGTVRAAVRTVGGSAEARRDFRPVRRILRWSDGQTGPVEFEIPLVDDQVVEPEEAFAVQLVEVRGAELGQPDAVRQSVVDDDRPMDLEAISDLEQEAPVRTELVLEARVVREDGAPVEGAPVRWRARGRARLADDEVVRSGEGGVVRQRLRLADVPGPAQVGAVLVGTESTLEFRIRVVGDLDRTVGDRDGDDRDVADILDEACADEEEGSRFREACEFLYGIEDPAARALALEALTPRQALPHQRQALRAPRNQVRNVSARLTALRGGMVRSAFDQLALSVRGEGLSLGPLQEAIAGALADGTPSTVSVHRGDGPKELRTDPEMEAKVALALRRAAGFEPAGPSTNAKAGAATADDAPPSDPVRGGAASADAPTGDGDAADDGFDYGGESPWGFFFNGRLSFGDSPRLGRRPGFDFETQGLTAGVDRRIGSDWVLGAALGYTSSETEIERQTGRLDLEGQSLSVYATYFTDRWYVDGVFTHGENEYRVDRVVFLPRPFRGRDRLVATGSPDATQTALNVGFGYDFRLADAGTVSGFLRANWTRAEIDSFTETGALLFNLQYDEQVLDSLLGEVGAELSYPFSFSWGVLQPLLRVAWLHEFEDDPDVLRARFALTRLDRRFRLEFERPDRDFLNVAVGATATFPRSWAAFFQYDVDLERDDLDLYTLSGGFRFQF